jgi:neopullulanase
MAPEVPAWPAERVFYQIFPDRFARSGRVPAPGALEPWDAPPTAHGFKGGDLYGAMDRLDDLVDLGIGAIYLNPVFSAASNHRYNAYDYYQVDPLLGGTPALRAFVDAAHERDLKVILDGVFNHAGRGFFPFQHVLENGQQSPYRDWFYFHSEVVGGRREIDAYVDRGSAGMERAGYASWWDIPSLPKIRLEHGPAREYVLGVAEHWLGFGIDGWRLDVPEEIIDETFWPEFRSRMKAIDPDAYLVGEIWTESPHWLLGDRFDALMNYPLGLAILGFASGGRLDRVAAAGQLDYARGLVPIDGPAFGERVQHLLTAHDPATTSVQFNLIGSHDAPRARTCLDGDAAAHRLALALLLTLPGAPSIYYGDELGMEGGPDPGCRGAYPVEPTDEGRAIRAFTKAVVAARHEHRALRRGTARTLAASGGAIALARDADGERAIVAVNSAREPARLELAAADVAGLAPVALPEAATGCVTDGSIIELPAQGLLILA